MCILQSLFTIKKNKYYKLFENIIFREIDFNEFLEIVIDLQGDTRDIYDEILKGFQMFDYGEFVVAALAFMSLISTPYDKS